MSRLTSDEARAWGVDDHTDVHFGLIPHDAKLNGTPFEPQYHKFATPSGNILVFAEGDSWVEWGEPVVYDQEHLRDPETGRYYGAPGVHVVVRFLPMVGLPPATALRPSEYYATGRAQRLAALAADVLREVFADEAPFFRLSDYAAVTDAKDWSQAPTWDTRAGDNKVVTFYA
ncbi:MAG: hypothetical protein HOV97_05555 [Nonomuraea sp.]|nr:hypothetical protein [Nonomuraea sp.]